MTAEYLNSVIRMATGFFFLFMAFNTTQALETTLVSDQTLAYATLGVLYGIFTATTIIAPKLVDMLGPRLGMVLGAIPYVLLVFANIAPSYGTLIPASAGVGFGAGLLWTSQGIYLSRCAIREAKSTGVSVDLVTSKMNGVFWTMFQFNAAVGLVISSVILGMVKDGAFSLEDAVKYMFTGFGAVGCVGIAILLSVKNAPALDDDAHDGGDAETGAGDADDSHVTKKKRDVTLLDTLRLIATSRGMQLLLPAIFYCGASLGFFGGTYPLIYQDTDSSSTSAGQNRLLPAAYVGYQAATFYAFNSFFSYVWGKLVPVVGRRALFLVTLLTLILFFGVVILHTYGWLTIGHQTPAAYAFVFGLAIVFAAGDSVIESQLPAIIQSPTFFPAERDRDAANSVNRMLQSLGYCAQFGIGIALPCKSSDNACMTQALVLLPLGIVALACVWACDKFVRPIDGGRAGDKDGEYAVVPADE